jgi:hypothetical protein
LCPSVLRFEHPLGHIVALQMHVPVAHVEAPAQAPDARSFHCPVASQNCGVLDAQRVGVGLGRQTLASETTSDELSFVVASTLSNEVSPVTTSAVSRDESPVSVLAVSRFASWEASVAPSLETSSASASAFWPASGG